MSGVEGLTPKQEKFCLRYFETGNASDAYRRVYAAEKMRPQTVNRKAFDQLKNGKIRARIAELRDAVAAIAVLKEAQVLEEIAHVAFSDPCRLFDDNGNLLPVHQMPREVRAAIASIEVVPIFEGQGKDRRLVGQLKRIKFWDKNAALDKAMRHLGLYQTDSKQRDSTPLEDLPRDTLRMIVEKLQGTQAG